MKTSRQWPRNSATRRGSGLLAPAGARLVCRGGVLLAAWGLILAAPPLVRAQSEDNAQYRIKLAFLYNFTQFVQWPSDAFPQANTPFVVCVAGQDPFDPDHEQDLRSRSIDKHPIVIKGVKRGANLRACHMVFVTAPESRQVASIVDSLKGSYVLTIGETKGFAERGGIINFTIEENKVHFEINLDAAKRTPLTISSKVLALARIVRDPPHM